MTEKDLSKIEVPKKLRLNMGQRETIAESLADKSATKARKDYGKEDRSKDLTKRLVEYMWVNEKNRKAAQNMPDGFFPTASRVQFFLGELNEHEVGMNGEKKPYISGIYAMFDLALKDGEKIIVPYHFTSPINVTDATGEIAEKWRSSRSTSNLSCITDADLEKDLMEFLTFETRIAKATTAFRNQAFKTLREVKSVHDLQQVWPAAFEVYCDHYLHTLQGTALVPVAPVSAVSKMIEDFPDIEEMMAA